MARKRLSLTAAQAACLRRGQRGPAADTPRARRRFVAPCERLERLAWNLQLLVPIDCLESLNMGRVCAWCGAVLRSYLGTSVSVSHGLCPGCLEELELSLAEQGLQVVESARQAVH